MADFSDHTVFITGAGAGIGAATAARYLADGARVIAVDHRPERLEAISSEGGEQVHAFAVDLRDKQATLTAIEQLPTPFRDISILVNNAGIGPGTEPAHKANLDDWEAIVDTNIKGLLYCTHAILPGMVDRGRGHVVNLASTAATSAYFGGNVYSASKAFVRQFSFNLRCDLLGKKVRVTAIEPGLIETSFFQVRFHGDEDRAKEPYKGVQAISADELADVIIYSTGLPEHMNITSLQVVPTQMASAGYAFARDE
jgi:NADP-dependent 3-hydroxy acid dehydrogenase YdfG